MNKICFSSLLIFFMIPLCVYAKKEEVKLSKCIDGDTISVLVNKEEKKVRFLAVDAPEIDKEEPYSKEAKDFTCNLVTNAKKLYLEYDSNADKVDKYERLLAWVWADNILLQKELVKNGYAKIAYLYDEYKYTNELKEFETNAKDNKLDIWSDYVPTIKKQVKNKSKKDILIDRINKSYEIIVIVIAGILALITLYVKRKK